MLVTVRTSVIFYFETVQKSRVKLSPASSGVPLIPNAWFRQNPWHESVQTTACQFSKLWLNQTVHAEGNSHCECPTLIGAANKKFNPFYNAYVYQFSSYQLLFLEEIQFNIVS